MDKSLFIFIMIGAAFLYFVTNFVGSMQEGNEGYQNETYKQEKLYAKFDKVDSLGDAILDVSGVDASTQLKAWNKCKLKNDFLEIFPDFSEMKTFVQERVRGDVLNAKLMTMINSVEDRYFSGKISTEQAKRELGALQ